MRRKHKLILDPQGFTYTMWTKIPHSQNVSNVLIYFFTNFISSLNIFIQNTIHSLKSNSCNLQIFVCFRSISNPFKYE